MIVSNSHQVVQKKDLPICLAPSIKRILSSSDLKCRSIYVLIFLYNIVFTLFYQISPCKYTLFRQNRPQITTLFHQIQPCKYTLFRQTSLSAHKRQSAMPTKQADNKKQHLLLQPASWKSKFSEYIPCYQHYSKA